MILEGLNDRYGRENGVSANQMEIEDSLLMKENSRMTDRQYNIIRESMNSAVPPLYRLKEKEKEEKIPSIVNTIGESTVYVSLSTIDTALMKYKERWDISEKKELLTENKREKPLFLLTMDGGGGTCKLSLSILNFDFPQSNLHYLLLGIINDKESYQTLSLFNQPVQ